MRLRSSCPHRLLNCFEGRFWLNFWLSYRERRIRGVLLPPMSLAAKLAASLLGFMLRAKRWSLLGPLEEDPRWAAPPPPQLLMSDNLSTIEFMTAVCPSETSLMRSARSVASFLARAVTTSSAFSSSVFASLKASSWLMKPFSTALKPFSTASKVSFRPRKAFSTALK